MKDYDELVHSQMVVSGRCVMLVLRNRESVVRIEGGTSSREKERRERGIEGRKKGERKGGNTGL